MPINRLVTSLCAHNQKQTTKEGRRPTGVGLLVIGYDKLGPHLFESLPNAEFNEYIAHAMGSRSQSALTFLEKNQKKVNKNDDENVDIKTQLDELITHVLKAIRTSYEQPLDSEAISIAFVGKDTPFTIFEDDKLVDFLVKVEEDFQEDEMVE
jgi:20S proteasome subunit alpha 6